MAIVGFALIPVAWYFPPPHYRWFCQSSITQSVTEGVVESETFNQYGSLGDRYVISKPRWLNPFIVEADVDYNPGPKAGWGVTLVLRLTIRGWQVVEEKNGFAV